MGCIAKKDLFVMKESFVRIIEQLVRDGPGRGRAWAPWGILPWPQLANLEQSWEIEAYVNIDKL